MSNRPENHDKESEASRFEVNRLNSRINVLEELNRVFKVGCLSVFANSSEALHWIEREFTVQSFYESEIRLLDSRIDELQSKLGQYRKYGLEVRRQFEEMLKSMYRYGCNCL
jgi:predicted RNase H-like nuclease (RuvC/YqgF family)